MPNSVIVLLVVLLLLLRRHHEWCLLLASVHLHLLLHLLHLEELLLHLSHHLVVRCRTIIFHAGVELLRHHRHHLHEILLTGILLLVTIIFQLVYLLLHFADLVLLDNKANLIVGVLGELLKLGGVAALGKHLAIVEYGQFGSQGACMVFVDEFVQLN